MSEVRQIGGTHGPIQSFQVQRRVSEKEVFQKISCLESRIDQLKQLEQQDTHKRVMEQQRLADKNALLLRQLRDTQQELAALKASRDYDLLLTENQHLKQQLDDYQLTLDHNEKHIDSLLADKDALATAAHNANLKLLQLQQHYDSLNHTHQDLQITHQQLHSTHSLAHNSLTDQLAQLTRHAAQLQNDLAQSQQENTFYQAKIEELSKMIQELQHYQLDLSNNVHSLNQQLSAKEQSYHALLQKCDTVGESLAQTKTKLDEKESLI